MNSNSSDLDPSTKAPFITSKNPSTQINQETEIQKPYICKNQFRFFTAHSCKSLEESITRTNFRSEMILSPQFNSEFSREINSSNEKQSKNLSKSEKKEKTLVSSFEIQGNFSFGASPRAFAMKLESCSDFKQIAKEQSELEKNFSFIDDNGEIQEIYLPSQRTNCTSEKNDHNRSKSFNDSNKTLTKNEASSNGTRNSETSIANNEKMKNIEKNSKQKIKIPKNLKKINCFDDLKKAFSGHIEALKSGLVMLKYGRRNVFGPAKRKIHFDESMSNIFWVKPPKNNENLSENLKKQKNIKKKFSLKEIKEITDGRKTDNFRRFKTNDEEKNNLSFSLILESRTIDLQAFTIQDKEKFLNSLVKVLLLRKKMMLGEALGIKL